MAEKQDRCWPGYEPVPGKEPHSQGSCKPKAESKSSPSEKSFRAKRKKQLDGWQAEHPKSSRQSAQHLAAPSTSKRTAAKKKTSSEKTAAKTTLAKQDASKAAKRETPTPKKTPVKRSTAKKTAATKKSASRKRA